MPYEIQQQNGKHCVFKQGGELIKCHDTEQEAKDHMAALYANVSEAKAVKFVEGTEDEIEGLLLPWGGIHNGKDLDGEYFSAKTNFCLEWFPEPATRPLLYDHGLDPDAGPTVVGRIKSIEIKADTGGWMQAQLDKQSKYFAAIKEMVERGKLYLSSGAMAHLVQRGAKGELLRWPVVEGSLTPTPANLLATVGYPEVAKHFKAIDVDLPESIGEIKLASTDMPDMGDDQKPRMVQKKPALTRARMREMAGEMGVKMTDEEMDAMMDEGMTEDEAKKRMEKMGKKSTDLLDLIETTEFANVPLADQVEGLNIIAASLFERTKDLNQRRVKEGRVLSGTNRKRLRESIAAMRTCMDEMHAWLDSTEPAPEGKTVDVWRLRVQAKALEINLLNA